ncbi:histidine kinase [Lysobacteraceae bacterium NML95-0200]|nr:histidine kinase [Xanthomonadaceae bacterium NML95-0200]
MNNYGRYQWLLFVAVAAIIIMPFWMLREMNQRIQDAEQALTDGSRTDAALSRLLYEARNLESAAASVVAGVDNAQMRSRIAKSMANIPVLVRELSEQSDALGIQQQLRIGNLQGRLEQRLDISQRIVQSTDNQERQRLLAMMADEMAMHSIANEVRKESRQLFMSQSRETEKLHTRGQRISLISMLVQLALLMALLWMLRRQQASRENAERALMAANARALAVVQAIREPIALLDGEQRIVMHNTAFAELYGHADTTHANMDGQPISQIGDGAWAGREILQRLRDVLSRDRELWDFELRQTTRDGIERTMLLNACRMSLPDHQQQVTLLTLSDISPHKAAETEISELNQQLQGKIEQISDVNRELEAFSYSVSHDLRSPLRHISGFAEKLGKQLGDGADDKSRHYLQVIDSSAKRMATLIDDLLVYSRLGRSALRLQPVDMQSMVEETRALLDANAQNETPGRHIEWNIKALPMVIADENMMRQVWSNLLGNAVKYSAPRAISRIQVSHQRLADGSHEFSVRDNGVGFDMAYASKLFGVFQRMHKPSEFPGTGIGLANVQRVLLRHGGQISAEAAPDQGATFRFTLPSLLDGSPAS